MILETLNLMAGSKLRTVLGPETHATLANVWMKILKSGISKKERKELLEKYLATVNCPLLQAAALNIEVKSIGSSALKKDRYQVSTQAELCSGAAGILLCLTDVFKL